MFAHIHTLFHIEREFKVVKIKTSHSGQSEFSFLLNVPIGACQYLGQEVVQGARAKAKRTEIKTYTHTSQNNIKST